MRDICLDSLRDERRESKEDDFPSSSSLCNFFCVQQIFNDKRAPTHNFVLNSCYFHTISPNFHFYHVSAVAYAIQGDDNRTNCILISFFQ